MEVVYFFHMRKISRSKGHAIDLMDLTPTSQMFLFCKYCWRQAARQRILCSLHTGGSAASGDPDTKPARYKSGQRRLKSFTDALNSLVTADVLEFHATEFQATCCFERLNWECGSSDDDHWYGVRYCSSLPSIPRITTNDCWF